jgi:glycosyltransferase involved in cell wall biosynthesis
MPAYNAGRFIREAVASALSQSFRALEVIVVDDGSADKVSWVVELDGERVRYHWKENGGPSSARNAAARLARGELIAFLDADDLWEPSKLERQVKALAAHPRAAFAYSAFRTIDHSGNPMPGGTWLGRPSGDIAVPLFMRNFVVTSSVVLRRSCFEEMGGFDESLIWAEDYDLWMRIAERYDGVYVDGVLGSYRINEQGLTRNFARLYEAERVVIDRAIARNGRPELRRHLRERLGLYHFEFGYDYLVHDRFNEARQQFFRSLRQWPWNTKAWRCWVRSVLPARNGAVAPNQPTQATTHAGNHPP